MKIRYSEHALDRLRERRIDKEEIVRALLYGNKYPAYDNLRRCEWNEIVVIYSVLSAEEVKIITAYRQNHENQI